MFQMWKTNKTFQDKLQILSKTKEQIGSRIPHVLVIPSGHRSQEKSTFKPSNGWDFKVGHTYTSYKNVMQACITLVPVSNYLQVTKYSIFTGDYHTL